MLFKLCHKSKDATSLLVTFLDDLEENQEADRDCCNSGVPTPQ